jgi:hypothetical protein
MFFINTRQPGETPQHSRVSVAINIETKVIPSYMLLVTLKTFISERHIHDGKLVAANL